MIRVGEAKNLYKTTKRTSQRTHAYCGNNVMVDLHGLTKKQALINLDESLPKWMDMAMQSSYPFVIHVTIVCGGGSQILAETVENWIRQKRNVANTPKSHLLG